jgi:4-hydroxy-tetrahydrodipicolinate synthase
VAADRQRFAALATVWAEGDLVRARELGHALARVSAAAFAEPNPVVIKAALHALGRIPTPHVRLPLLPAAPDSVDVLLRRLAELDGPAAGSWFPQQALQPGQGANPPGAHASVPR